MAHYAKIDKNNIVIKVLVIDEETVNSAHFGDPSSWIKTSYNTNHGEHQLGGTPLRKNYAAVGYTYDLSRDAFIPPQPFPSWTFNEDTYWWDPPQPLPARDEWKYTWNESSLSWEQTVKRRWTGSLD